MKGLYKRIISGVLVLVTIFLTCFPVAFASSEGSLDSYKPTTLWDWAKSEDNLGWNFLKSLFDKDVCPKSPNTNGLHEFVKATTTIDGKTGLYYVCKHCGKSAGEVGEEAYQEQVSTLPASGYTSDGGLIWQVTKADLYDGYKVVRYSSSSGSGSTLYESDGDFSFNSTGTGIILRYPGDGTVKRGAYACIGFQLRTPVAGSYFLLESPVFSLSTVPAGGSYTGTDYYPEVSYYVSENARLDFNLYSWNKPSSLYIQVNSGFYTLIQIEWLFPMYKIIPDTSIPSDTYNINTRPTTITGGNYGIVGDDNNITTVTNTTQIVNEGDNLYYNPATGQTQTITDWKYNYDGRIYDITLDTGDKVSVEYGDENITITENTVNEGDTVADAGGIVAPTEDPALADTPDSPGTLPEFLRAMFGTYTPKTQTVTTYFDGQPLDVSTEYVPGLAGLDVEWIASVVLFGVVVYCLFRLLGGVVK